MSGSYRVSPHFSPRQYEAQLSQFGRKVLSKMLLKWNADKNTRHRNFHNSYQQQNTSHISERGELSQNKKILTFRSEERTELLQLVPPITLLDTTSKRENDDCFDFPDIRNNKPPVPTAAELFKTIDKNDDAGQDRDDFLASNSVRVYNGNNKISNNDLLKGLDSEMHGYNLNDDVVSTVPRVNWDDMFDCDLLLEAATNAKLMIQQNSSRNACNIDTVNIEFPNDHISKTINNLKSENDEINDKVKKNKRKTQSKVTDAITKKVKKTKEPEKPSFRKQNYTKTVKNWLNDVDPQNPVTNSESPNISTAHDIGIDNTSVKCDEVKQNEKTKIVIEKAKEKGINKKVVQARLANKGGVMKFDNPKDKIETTATKTASNFVDKTKEKKSKTKFVAPIKSQIPVKEVTYKVITVNDTNIDGYKSAINEEHFNVNIVLVYSNGFSQLNMHYTEDDCRPEGIMINIKDEYYYFKGFNNSFREVLACSLEQENLICYEGKNIYIYLKSAFGIELFNLNIIDVKIGGSLLDPENPPDNFSDVQKLLAYCPKYTIATECSLQKTAWYLTLLDTCGVRLTSSLKEEGLWGVFVDIEMKLLPIIAEMEYQGVMIDLEKLKSMEEILLTKMKEVEAECHKAAGKTFQITSAVQIRNIIYDELQLDTKCNVKIKETIGQGAKSTSEIMLRSLISIHPLPKLILEYRHLHKAHATFLTGIAQHVKDNVVRPTWVQTAAATGRIASNNPNLQAIPKAPFSLILFPDENNSGNATLSIRSVYQSRSGWSLVAADFQHVECRVFAHCAADAALQGALQGPDLFRTLAATWLKKPVEEVSAEDRERTKRIVYAGLYGAGSRKLMDLLGLSYEQTLAIIATFNRTFPSLKSFGRSVVARCEQNGGRLSTLCGRGRRFKNISSVDFQLKSQAERQAVNFIVQGSAADLCKLAMVSACERMRARRPPVPARLLLQIHDELVWEVRDQHIHEAAVIIKDVMENCGRRYGMDVLLPVAISTGRTWGDMTPYTQQL